MKQTIIDILDSWRNTVGSVHTTEELLNWIEMLNSTTYVNIKECGIEDSNFWFYDDYNGEILNNKRSFFSIKGLRRFEDNIFVGEQPIIIQPEIGYLGIICKKINGVMNFLMQAKIEPGNVNCVQISPTIQATKSNFTRAHGGKLPAYFEYFENSRSYHVIYDQIQSEQSARFYKKRNRNMIMEVQEDIEELPNFKWMTLGQIKQFMKMNNLVNMDTRTVLSGIPFVTVKYTDQELGGIEKFFHRKSFFNSIFLNEIAEELCQIYQYVNQYKMFHDIERVQVPLNQLVDWYIDNRGISCNKKSSFVVRYYDIAISGREVQHWTQPLFKAVGQAVFGLIFCVREGNMKFLVSAKSEIGIFDKIEIGPSIQMEAIHTEQDDNLVEKVFRGKLLRNEGIEYDTILSEEGGRFYHEQNRNVILRIDEKELENLPEGYFWVGYGTLNYMMQINNCLNIQLRNLLSLLDI